MVLYFFFKMAQAWAQHAQVYHHRGNLSTFIEAVSTIHSKKLEADIILNPTPVKEDLLSYCIY